MIIQSIFETEPDGINEQGTKFWVDEITTDYAESKGINNITVFYVQTKNDYKSSVIINDKKEYIYESQKLEEVGAFIDKLVIAKEFNDNRN